MKRSVITSILALGGLLGLSQSVMATCVNSGAVADRVISLQVANLTVGRDVPLGSRFYRQEFSANLPNSMLCTSASGGVTFEDRSRWVVGPMRLASWNTGPLAGKVYESGVPGIGVAFFAGGAWMPGASNIQYTNCGTNNPCSVSLDGLSVSVLELVKISDVVGSGVISGNSFPAYEHFIYQDGASYPYLRSSFSGSINVVSRTCQTPNVEVDMGVHKVSAFSQANSATPWKDFFITLNNCPTFYGTNPRINGNWAVQFNTSNIPETRATPSKSNSLQVNLTGTVPAVDTSLGILALNSAEAGSGWAATGVGIQVADANGVPVQIGPNTWIPSGVATQSREGASYTIPLKARYLKTTGPVGAGQANATVHFTISYQ
ncbi:fimbrial protein [Pseudomonas sp. GT1P32]